MFSFLVNAKASLSNSLRSTFHFVVEESVTIMCLVDSYPYVDAIQIKVNGLPVTSIPNYMATYAADTISHNQNMHSARFTIKNVTGK